jgi:hypothetical protein
MDFILWRIGPLMLVILTVAAGITMYAGLGSPNIRVQLKSILTSALMGYGVVFLAWTGVNLILSILGYKISVFGPWWEINQ